MKRLQVALVAVLLAACGPKPGRPDSGGEDDAGTDGGADAGRVRGTDPGTGYSLAIPVPAAAPPAARYGVSVSAVADQFGQPMLAAINVDPNGDGVFQDNALVFTRWDGTANAFQALKTIEVLGEIDVSHPNRQVSLARDADTGLLGVAYVNASGNMRLAFSVDEGANWSLETATAPASLGHTLSNPQLTMKAGQVAIAYLDGAARVTKGGIVYRVRTGSGAFVDSAAPLLAGTDGVPPGPISLGLDSMGLKGLAYFLTNSVDATVTLAFWRPAAANATRIADSALTANDGGTARQPSVSLTFDGELPRVAYHLSTPDPNAQVWFAAATDAAGTAWGAPVPMPRNGPNLALEGTQWYQAIAVEGAKVSIVSNYAQATMAAQQCGGPKLSRSNDGAIFTTCAPDTMRLFGFAGQFANLFTHKPGKLTLVFNYENRSNPTVLGGGVVMWREP